MSHEDIESLNQPIASKEIEIAIKILPSKKIPGPNGFPAEFYKTIRNELNPILHKVIQEIKRDGILPNSFYEASIMLIPKPNKDTLRKENYRPISLMNIDAKILNKILAMHIQKPYQENYTPQPSWFHPRKASLVQHMQINTCFPPHKQN